MMITKKQLLKMLEGFMDNEYVLVAIHFRDERAEVVDVDSVTRNGKSAQLNVRSSAKSSFDDE